MKQVQPNLWKFLKYHKMINFVYRNKKNINVIDIQHISCVFSYNEYMEILLDWEKFYFTKIHKTNKINVLNEFLIKENIKDEFYSLYNNNKENKVNINEYPIYKIISYTINFNDAVKNYVYWMSINIKYINYLDNKFKDLYYTKYNKST